MNQRILEEKFIVLRNQIRIAIALYMLNSCSQSKNLRDHIEEIQNVYRNKSKKCNIALERKVFLQQIVLLLPKSDDFQPKQEPLPTPMEVDIDGEINLIYVDFSLKLMMLTEFLDGLHVLQTLLKLESVSSEDIFRILSKFDDSEFNFRYHKFRMIKISINAVKQCLVHMNIKEVAKECIIEIVRLFKIYLKDLPQEQSLSSEEALVWMKRANNAIMKSIDSFAYEGQYQDIIMNLLYESVESTFIQQPKYLHFELYRYHLVRKWRYHKLLCANVLNIFIINLQNIKEKIDDLEKRKCFIILKFTKLFLETFCGIHYGKSNLQFLSKDITSYVAEESFSNRYKNHIFPSDKKCLKTWGKCLGSLITPKCRSATIISLAYSCTKIISSTKEFQKR